MCGWVGHVVRVGGASCAGGWVWICGWVGLVVWVGGSGCVDEWVWMYLGLLVRVSVGECVSLGGSV